MSKQDGTSQRNYQNAEKGLGGFKDKSRTVGNDQNEAIDADSQRKDRYREAILRRRDVAGGILSQLIEDSEDQLAHIRKQEKRLIKRIQSLNKLKDSLAIDNFDED